MRPAKNVQHRRLLLKQDATHFYMLLGILGFSVSDELRTMIYKNISSSLTSLPEMVGSHIKSELYNDRRNLFLKER